jgi:hypothetical protein
MTNLREIPAAYDFGMGGTSGTLMSHKEKKEELG